MSSWRKSRWRTAASIVAKCQRTHLLSLRILKPDICSTIKDNVAKSFLQVIIPPIDDPKITGIKNRYRIGDYLKTECKSRNSFPAANLTWFVNGKDVEPIHIRHQKAHVTDESLYTYVLYSNIFP
ncbi:beat protein [Holotrichia oblita]|uniref:Beat protein n=1 Tax=Holotrichia oblita TaxID=644536 RepID=A0ACB9SQI5_HOLOL|nr:beat protein [Holotrichia oblita]